MRGGGSGVGIGSLGLLKWGEYTSLRGFGWVEIAGTDYIGEGKGDVCWLSVQFVIRDRVAEWGVWCPNWLTQVQENEQEVED